MPNETLGDDVTVGGSCLHWEPCIVQSASADTLVQPEEDLGCGQLLIVQELKKF